MGKESEGEAKDKKGLRGIVIRTPNTDKEESWQADGEKTVIFDCGSRLYVCPKAKDCQPANHEDLCVCVGGEHGGMAGGYVKFGFLIVSYSSLGLRRIQWSPSGCC